MIRRTLYPKPIWVSWVLVLPLALIALGLALVATTERDALLFDASHLWWLGGVGPVAGLMILWSVSRRRQALERLTSSRLAPLLAWQVQPGRQAFRAALFVIALLLLGAAIVGPRWGKYLEKQRVFGVDIVVALDVSRSMLARDVRPNRMEVAKELIRQQLTERPVFGHTNRLALMAFAGSTSLRLPLTTDHLAFRSKLEQVHIGAAPRGGTAIAQAIEKATDLFAKSPRGATKIILLFTDGEDHEGDPVEAARRAFEEQGIRTFTIGVGDPSRTVGAQVPESAGPGSKPLLHDGQIVFSRLDVAGLQNITRAGGGQFAPIHELHRLVNAVAAMHRTHLTTEERIRHRPRYQWFLAAALLLLMLETIVSETGTVEAAPMRLWQQEAA